MKRINAKIDIIIRNSNIDEFNKKLEKLVSKYSYTMASKSIELKTSHNIRNSYNKKTAGKVYLVYIDDKQYTFVALRVTKDLIKGILIDDSDYNYKDLLSDKYPIAYFRYIKNKGYITTKDYFRVYCYDEVPIDDINTVRFESEGEIYSSLLADLVFKYKDKL